MLAQPPLLWLINTLIDLYIYILIAAVILQLLVSFGIVNRHQPLVQQIGGFLSRMTEPLLSRIRKRLPPMGGIDISPLILFIALQFTQYCVNYLWLKYLL
jgi:YggT family protein